MINLLLDYIHHNDSKLARMLCKLLDEIEYRLIYSNLWFKGFNPFHHIGMNLFFYRLGDTEGFHKIFKREGES